MNSSALSCPGLRALLLGVGLILAGCGQRPGKPDDDSSSPSTKPVSALGRLEPLHGIIHLTAAPGDRVISWNDLKVGDTVKAKDELVVLDSKDFRYKEWKLAEEQHKLAKDQLTAVKRNGAAQRLEARLKNDRIKEGLKEDVSLAEKKVALARSQLELEQSAYKSVADLSVGSVAGQDKDRQKLKMEAAELDVASAVSAHKKAREAATIGEKESQAQLDALDAALDRAVLEVESSIATAAANLDVAWKRYQASQVKAPADGVILSIHTHKGEAVGQRPLVRMGDTSQLAVIAEVDEADALRIAKGQTAYVTNRLFGDPKNPGDLLKIPGTVESIGKIVGRNSIDELNPAARADRRVVEVKIRLGVDGKLREQLANLINLQVNVVIGK